MSISAYIPLLVAVIGAIVYYVGKTSRIAEMGRIAYAAGLFAQLFGLAGHMVKLLG